MSFLRRLGKGIEETKYVLADLKNFNDQQWHVRYPSLRSMDKGEESSRKSGVWCPVLHRSLLLC